MTVNRFMIDDTNSCALLDSLKCDDPHKFESLVDRALSTHRSMLIQSPTKCVTSACVKRNAQLHPAIDFIIIFCPSCEREPLTCPVHSPKTAVAESSSVTPRKLQTQTHQKHRTKLSLSPFFVPNSSSSAPTKHYSTLSGSYESSTPEISRNNSAVATSSQNGRVIKPSFPSNHSIVSARVPIPSRNVRSSTRVVKQTSHHPRVESNDSLSALSVGLAKKLNFECEEAVNSELSEIESQLASLQIESAS